MEGSILNRSRGSLKRPPEEQVQALEDDLQGLRTSIMDLSKEDNSTFTHNCLINQLRELSYDAEDYLEMARHSSDGCWHINWILSKMKLLQRPLTAKDISELRSRVEDTMAIMKSYKASSQAAPDEHVVVIHDEIQEIEGSSFLDISSEIQRVEGSVSTSEMRSPVNYVATKMYPLRVQAEPHGGISYYELQDHIGLEEPMSDLISLLALDGEPQVRAVAIFGPAGVGKTTLARRLYHCYRGRFHCTAFLRVNQKLDTRRLLATMLSQIKGSQCHFMAYDDEEDLIDNIKQHLQGKSYLIVVNDLWDTSVWDTLSRAFQMGNFCSRIIITTQKKDVALACKSHSEYILNMKPLNGDQSLQFFNSRISQIACYAAGSCKEISNVIISNGCDGLPLAITNIAGMLAGWPDFRIEEWKYVQDWVLHTFEGMQGVLNLIYNNLPPKLKTCLLYLSIYPGDYIIQKDDLVRQWAAEGIFSQVNNGHSEELQGDYSFTELLKRGLLQPADIDNNFQVLSCTVHHIILDFIAQKSMQENFVTVVNYPETVRGHHGNKVRRLSVRFGGAKSAQIPESLRISQVRSLMFTGFYKCMPSLKECCLVRVLILHIWSGQDKRILDLAIIGELFQLRYLRIKANVTVKLPATIRGLKYLQTLEVDSKVAAAPVDIFCLQHLLHLRFLGEPFLSPWSKHMLLVPCLDYVNLSNRTCLLDLHLNFSAVPCSRQVSNIKCLASILGKFTNLKSLVLDGEASSNRSTSCDSLSTVSSPPVDLQRLVLSQRVFIMSCLPEWIKQLTHLRALEIAVRQLSPGDIDIIKELPFLAAFSIYVRSVQTTPGGRLVFKKEIFLALKFFEFICPAPCLGFEKEAMPQVQSLKLGFNANTMRQYSLFDAGFENLKTLKVISAKIGCAGADQASREGAKLKVVAAFSKSDCSPIINVQLLDSSVCSETEQSSAHVTTKGDAYEQYGIWENNSTEDTNRPADNRINSTESSLGVQKPGWVSRRPLNGVHLVNTVQGLIYVVRRYLKQPGFRITNEVASVVEDLERVNIIINRRPESSQPHDWVLQMQDLAYDIQDFVDIYSWLSIRSWRHALAHMSYIVQLKERIRTIQEWQQSGISSHGGSGSGSGITLSRPWSSGPYVPEDKLVGIDQAKSELLDMLLLPGELEIEARPLKRIVPLEETVEEVLSSQKIEGQKPRVVSVVGYRGIGKTALARAVYHDPCVRSAFDYRAWVSASECSHGSDLLYKIQQQVQEQDNSTIPDFYILKEILRKRRFLAVIDDLQGAGMWDDIQSVFPETHNGSRIIVTTSIHSVAAGCSPEQRYIYRMRGLDSSQSEKLFWMTVGSRASRTPATEYDLGDTLRKCGGLPLALIGAANYWCRNKHLPQGATGAFEEMNRVLTQCYESLPDNGHRTCFLSLSTFPQGRMIKRKRIIRKWVGEGLAVGEGGLSAEQVASNRFDELIDRNIIEPVLNGENSRVKGCLVLGVVKDFIANKSVSEGFASMIRNGGVILPNTRVRHPIRRLSVHGATAQSGRLVKGIELNRVRSLTISNAVPFEFQGCWLLRVLDLEGCHGIGRTVLHDIWNLVFLKYLSLRGSDVYKISKKIRNLECLETLDIRETRVETLPLEVFMLPQLVHLFGQFELPPQLKDPKTRSKLHAFFADKSRLQTLSGFFMVENNGFEYIMLRIRRLRKVKLWCNHSITSTPQGHLLTSSLEKRLAGSSAIESISVDFGNESINFLNNIRAPCAHISSMKLRGRLISLPSFISSHDTTLSRLHLYSTRLSLEALSLLQNLRRLVFLKLVEDGDGFWGGCFDVQSGGFPSLLALSFEAPELPQVHIHEGGMSALTSLQLLCPEFRDCSNSDSGGSYVESGVHSLEMGMGRDPQTRTKEINLEINFQEIREIEDADSWKKSELLVRKGSITEMNMEGVNEEKVETGSKKGTKEIREIGSKSRIDLEDADSWKKSELLVPKDSITEMNMEGVNEGNVETGSKKGAKEIREIGSKSRIDLEDADSWKKSELLVPKDSITEMNMEGVNEEKVETGSKKGTKEIREIGSKSRIDLKTHFRGIKHLRRLTEVVLHSSVKQEVLDAWNDEARSHTNRPKVTTCVPSLCLPGIKTKGKQGQGSSGTTTHEDRGPGNQTEVLAGKRPVVRTEHHGSTPTIIERPMLELRKYILLLASLVAMVTYAAGFRPPGDVWQNTAAGHCAGEPIIRGTRYSHYLVFFYCNATAFAASIVVIALSLIVFYLEDMVKHSNSRIMCHYKKNPWIAVRALQIVMVSCLLSLVGAYYAATSWTMFITIIHTGLLGGVFFLYFLIRKVVASCFTEASRVEHNVVAAEEPLIAGEGLRLRKILKLLGAFAVSITYVAGLTAPGGFWDNTNSGVVHSPGDPILKDHARLAVFFGFNTMGFVASLLIILATLERKLRKTHAYAFAVATLVGVVGAYTAGSWRKTSGIMYILIVFCSVLIYMPLLAVWQAMRASSGAECNHNDSTLEIREEGHIQEIAEAEHQQTAGNKDKALDKARSQLVVLFGTLAATVTYQAGMHPPGGFWEDNRDRHKAGDPILLTTSTKRYNAFFYFNSVAFVASLLATMLVVQSQRKHVLTRLRLVIMLDLFALVGAYSAGSSRDLETSIYTIAMAGAVLGMVIRKVVAVISLGHRDHSKDGDSGHRTRTQLYLFAIVAATITYQSGLSPPGGFLLQVDQSGHRAGNPLLMYSLPRRYRVFFYGNSAGFLLSIIVIIDLFITRIIYRPGTRIQAVCTAACLFGLIGAYAAGSTQQRKTSIYVFVLTAFAILPLLLFILILLRSGSKKAAAETISNSITTTTQSAAMETNSAQGEEEKATIKKRSMDNAKRKYLMLIGILMAGATYKAGLEPPGGAWKSSSQGYTAGDQVMHDMARNRYLIFFYSNSTSFLASILVILLQLVPEKIFGYRDKQSRSSRWAMLALVLGLLGILVAYAAGSSRGRASTTFVIVLPTTGVLVYMAMNAAAIVSNIRRNAVTWFTYMHV